MAGFQPDPHIVARCVAPIVKRGRQGRRVIREWRSSHSGRGALSSASDATAARADEAGTRTVKPCKTARVFTGQLTARSARCRHYGDEPRGTVDDSELGRQRQKGCAWLSGHAIWSRLPRENGGGAARVPTFADDPTGNATRWSSVYLRRRSRSAALRRPGNWRDLRCAR